MLPLHHISIMWHFRGRISKHCTEDSADVLFAGLTFYLFTQVWLLVKISKVEIHDHFLCF